MFARAIKVTGASLARRTTVGAATKRFMGGHGHGPRPPTFVRLPQPNKPIHEESELIWHDGVAPEVTIDFDAPEVSKLRGLACWAAGLSFFVGLMLFSKFVVNPADRNPAAKRELDVDDALGNYPRPRKAAESK